MCSTATVSLFLVLSKPLLDSQRLIAGKPNKAFWHGFHSRDNAEMYARLIDIHPDQPSGVYFDYMGFYKVARVTFLGDHLLYLELEDPWDEPRGTRISRTNRALERWLEQEKCDHRVADR